jgi:proline iminopeptidase
VPRIVLVGHSVGTIIAMEYGAKYPRHVSRMILAAAGPDIPATFNIQCDRLAHANPDVYARARAAVREGSARTCNVYDGAFEGPGLQQFVNSNMFPDPRIERLVSEADTRGGLRNTGELGRALIQQGLLEYRFRQASRLTMPVLIIAGTDDHQANIEPQRAFAGILPNAQILEYAGRGHFMFAEDPQRFARDVVAFVQGRVGPRSPN